MADEKRFKTPTVTSATIVQSLLAVVVIAVGYNLSSAQIGRLRSDAETGAIIQAPRNVERLLEDAQEAIDRKAWSEATLALGMLLGIESQMLGDELGRQDYFQPNDLEPGTLASIREAALRFAEEVPDEGMKVFELRYGVAAQQALQQAIELGDWRAIERIAGDYAPTTAGREAAWLVSEAKIHSGHPIDAAVRLERLMRQSRAQRQFGFNGFLLAAASWKIAGQDSKAEAVLEEGQKIFPSASLKVDGNQLSSSSSLDTWLKVLKTSSAEATRLSEKTARWVGGSLDRNGEYPGGVPLPLVNWLSFLHESDQNELAAKKTLKQKANDRQVSLVPSRVPVVVPPWIFVMSYDQRIHAIHLRSGKLMWSNSFNPMSSNLQLDRLSSFEADQTETPMNDYLIRRIWGEMATGQLSSDGVNVYSISELPSVDAAESSGFGANARVFSARPRSSYNVLHAWPIESQLKLLWQVGGETGLSEPQLAGVLFLGTPIEHAGELLLLGELNGEVYLFSLAPENGKLNWMQQLVANQSITIVQDTVRRNMSCSPAIAANHVICPTLSGQLVAFDLTSRTLRWAIRYEQSPEASSGNFNNPWGSVQGVDFVPMGVRSTETSVVVAGNVVVHAPPDSLLVYAVDLLTGEKLWELPKPRNRTLYIGGIWQDRLLLVQDQLVNCHNIHTGENAWKSPIPLASIGRVAGRGIRNGQRFFLPMSNQEILEIDFETGEIADRMRVKEPLGNLATTVDQLISMSPVALTAYSIRDRLRTEIDLGFAADINATGRLQRQGKILLAEGKIDEALATVERAYQADPNDPDTRLLLKEVALMAIQQDFQKYAELVAKYEVVVNFGPERAIFMVSVIEGLLSQKRYVAGFEKLLSMADTIAESMNYSSSTTELLEPEAGLQVRQDLWMAAKMAQFYDAADPVSRASIRAMILPRLEKLAQSAPSRERERKSELYRWLSESASLRLGDARNFIHNQELLLAEQTLEEISQVVLQKSTDTSAAPDSFNREGLMSELDQLRIELYGRASRWHASREPVERLKLPIEQLMTKLAEFSPTANALGRGAEIPSKQSVERFFGGLPGWPIGRVQVELKPSEVRTVRFSDGQICSTKQRVGSALEGWSVSSSFDAIAITSPDGNQRLFGRLESRALQDQQATVHILDSIVILETANELMAMDTLRAAEAMTRPSNQSQDYVIWRHALTRPTGFDPNNMNPRVRMQQGIDRLTEKKPWGELRPKNRKGFYVGPVARTGLLVATNNTLTSFDPRTRSQRWIRSGVGDAPSIVQDGFQVAVLDTAGARRWILDARDGSSLATHEWRDEFEVWCASGKHVLSTFVNRRKEGLMTFKLWDAFTGETILLRDFDATTRANVWEQERFVALNAQGELVVWDLGLGREWTYTVPLPKDILLERIHLERFEDRLVLLSQAKRYEGGDIVPVTDGDQARRCHGPMLALDLTTGKPLWDRARIVHDYLIPVSQVRDTPVIVLVRPLQFRAGGRIPTQSASVAMIDLRDGQLIYANDYLDSTNGLAFQTQAQLDKGEVNIVYRGSQFRVSWSDEPPIPPQENMSDSGFQEIGKIELDVLETQTPPEYIERLQALEQENRPGSFPPDLFDLPKVPR